MTFFFFFFGFGFGFVFLFYYYFFNIVLTWKIVEDSKASVLYIYIDYMIIFDIVICVLIY